MKAIESTAVRQLMATSVGKKIVVSLTGFFLIVFVLINLIGNMLLYVGQDSFNYYTYNLTQNKGILYFMEVVLLLGFLSHIVMTYRTTRANQKARPVTYKKKKTLGMSTIFSSNMGITGSLIFIFLVLHIRTFKFGEGSMVDVAGVPGAQVIDMYTIVVTSFQQPWYALIYILAMVLLGGHLSHGAQSAFRSLGFYDTKIKKFLNTFALAIGIIIGGGFASIPIYFGFIV